MLNARVLALVDRFAPGLLPGILRACSCGQALRTLILEGSSRVTLVVVLRRAAPLGVEINAIVVRVPSHVVPVHMGCHHPKQTRLRA